MGIEIGPEARARGPLSVPPFAVGRPRLVDRLDDVRPGGLGLVVASAGSGKSVLLAQWSATAPETHLCPVHLGQADADAVVCARHLVGAVRGEVPGFAPGVESMVVSGGGALGSTFVDAFLDGLARAGADLALVVEDLHLVDGPGVTDDLGRILTGLPLNARAVATSRWDPGFSVRQARLAGRLVELRGADLAFDAAEGRALVAAVTGEPLSDEQGAALVARTDGWAVGLQLAAVALKGAEDLTGAIDVLAGDDRLVAEYLTAEVLDQQEPEVRRFLLRTSVLEWLDEEVCDAVTGDGNAARMLDEVVARSLFLVPLDRGGHRFRYHHLFADLLRLRLRAQDPDDAAARHAAAAAWLLERDRLAEAVEHLLAAGDHDGAFRLIARHGHQLYERGEAATLVRWTKALTRHPDASAEVVINLLAAQVGSDDATGGRETYRRLCARTDLSAEEQATADAYYSCFVQCDLGVDEVERAAAAVVAVLPDLRASAMPEVLGLGGIDAVEALARFSAALAAVKRGVPGAAARLEELLGLPALGYPAWRTNMYGWLSIAQVWTGHLREGARHAAAAREVAGDGGIADHVAAGASHLAVASIALEQGDRRAADEALEAAERATRRSGRASLHGLQRLVRARHLAATEGPWAGLEALRRPVATPAVHDVFAAASDALELGLLVQLGRLAQAETVLRRAGATSAVTASHVDLLLARDDVAGARRVLDSWSPHPDDLRAATQHGIRTVVVLDAEGRGAEAREVLLDTVARAEPEGLRRPFRAVPTALRLLRDGAQGGPHSFAASILDEPVSPQAARAAAAGMVEPLTEREQSVLVHLPTRLSNTEIAAELYISVNTMKTHVRNIYRKLSVSDRDAAVARATDIGLL